MSEEMEMFEAIEMHVERMLSQVSETEVRSNPMLSKFETKMRRLLERVRERLMEKESKANQAGENSNE
jgi:DNA topoisomerase IA